MQDIFDSYPQIQLSLALRLGMIQKDSLPNLSLEQFSVAVSAIKWKAGIPSNLHEVINDIFSITADEVVSYLAKKAVIDARKNSLDELASYFGGNS